MQLLPKQSRKDLRIGILKCNVKCQSNHKLYSYETGNLMEQNNTEIAKKLGFFYFRYKTENL